MSVITHVDTRVNSRSRSVNNPYYIFGSQNMVGRKKFLVIVFLSFFTLHKVISIGIIDINMICKLRIN